MRAVILAACAAATVVGGAAGAQTPERLNPMIDLHAARKPVLGLYAPANPRAPRAPRPAGGPAGSVATPVAAVAAPAPRSVAELAREALGRPEPDFIFDGSMEGDFEAGYAGFTDFMRVVAGMNAPLPRRPIVVKTPQIGADRALAAGRIARQLDLGASTIVFVDVESADELRSGIAAMRFAADGGTRPDRVGTAPAAWGVSEARYRSAADVWPLDPRGALTAWAVVESRDGLERVREIAAVKGLAVLFPGAGTMRGLFSTVDAATGQRTLDTAAWEGAIARVLAACKEFDVPCGYPANDPETVEARMKQGFSVFIAGWGESGFRAVAHGKQASGR